MVNAFLKQSTKEEQDTEAFIKKLVYGDELKGIGGFSLICGKVGEPLAVISNRTPSVEGVTWIAGKSGETVGLSNAIFSNKSWPKVNDGKKLMVTAIASSVARKDTKKDFVEELMGLLSIDTLPKKNKEQSWDGFIKELRLSILIPRIGGQGMDSVRAEDIAAAKSEQPVGVYNAISFFPLICGLLSPISCPSDQKKSLGSRNMSRLSGLYHCQIVLTPKTL